MFIPLYIDPNHKPGGSPTTDWEYLAQLGHDHPAISVMAVINPYNGPGAGVQEHYTRGIGLLKASGIRVLGYLPVGYLKTPAEQVKSMLANWFAWYPAIDGIFLDEFPSSYDQAAAERCRLFAETDTCYVINPGMRFEVSRKVTDLPFSVVISWENREYPTLTDSVIQLDALSHLDKRMELGCLVLEQRVKGRLVKKQLNPVYDWMFITPFKVEENPWGKLDRKALAKLFSLQA